MPEAAGTGLGAKSQDARLYVDPRALRAAAPRSVHERPDGDAGASVRAHLDSAAAAGRRLTVLGRRITVPSDSTAHRRGSLHVDLMGRRATMPVDGRDWEDLQLRRQQEAFERDSVLRERVRAMRERRTAERAAGRPR